MPYFSLSKEQYNNEIYRFKTNFNHEGKQYIVMKSLKLDMKTEDYELKIQKTI